MRTDIRKDFRTPCACAMSAILRRCDATLPAWSAGPLLCSPDWFCWTMSGNAAHLYQNYACRAVVEPPHAFLKWNSREIEGRCCGFQDGCYGVEH